MRSLTATLLIGLAQSTRLDEQQVHTTHGYSAHLAQTKLQADLSTAIRSTTFLPGDEPLSFTEKNLIKHNEYRELHGACPLSYDAGLEEAAQTKADKMALTDDMSHDTETYGQGENLGRNLADYVLTSDYATTTFYDEIDDYDFNNPELSYDTGHFTQVIWKGSKLIGCGAATSASSGLHYYACRYFPAGNYENEGWLEINVLPANSTPTDGECCDTHGICSADSTPVTTPTCLEDSNYCTCQADGEDYCTCQADGEAYCTCEAHFQYYSTLDHHDYCTCQELTDCTCAEDTTYCTCQELENCTCLEDSDYCTCQADGEAYCTCADGDQYCTCADDGINCPVTDTGPAATLTPVAYGDNVFCAFGWNGICYRNHQDDLATHTHETCVHYDRIEMYMDSMSRMCYQYVGRDSWCGLYDTDDFIANEDCCSCGGGGGDWSGDYH